MHIYAILHFSTQIDVIVRDIGVLNLSVEIVDELEESLVYNRIGRHIMSKHIRKIAASLAVCAIFLVVSYNYYSYTSDLILKESTNHLEEIYAQMSTSFDHHVMEEWSSIRNWADYLNHADTDEERNEFTERLQDAFGFSKFYYVSYAGNYLTSDGKTGNLGLSDELIDLFANQTNITSRINEEGTDLELFITPCSESMHEGFTYNAIAVGFDSHAMGEFLADKAYVSVSDSYVVETDGNIIMNESSDENSITNVFTDLAHNSSLSKEQILNLQKEIAMRNNGVIPATVNSTPVYIVYQPLSLDSWALIGIVPKSAISSNMTRIQFSTLMVGSGLLATLCLVAGYFITKRNRQILSHKDAELKYQEACFESLSRNTEDIFISLDQKDLTVNYVTPNVEEVLGFTVQQIKDRLEEVDQIIQHECKAEILKSLRTLHMDDSVELDIVYRKPKDSSAEYFHVLGVCKEISGISRYIVVFSNRTKEMKANIALGEALKEANRASQAKSVFLSNMSHDIRTPMNAILGYTALAQSRLNNPQKLENYLSKITLSGNYLLSLINDILDMSRIESGKVTLDEAEVNLNQLIDRMLTVISGQIAEKHLHFTKDIRITDADIICDRTRLNQVFINIISNAIKFTPDEGNIHFSICQYASEKPDYAEYEIRVSDTGIGMSQEFLQHIFEPFEREYTGASDTPQGTGLGMAITKSIVDMMNGTITVCSRPGKGTEFRLLLSFRISHKSDYHYDEEEKPLKVHFDNRLLLVEDNPLNREIATEILHEYGFTVDTSNNGQEALEKLEQEDSHYDLILMDIQMPVMNGLECAKAIHSSDDPRFNRIPIVAMTANAFEEDHRSALAAGMNEFMTKPIRPDELLRILRKLLG